VPRTVNGTNVLLAVVHDIATGSPDNVTMALEVLDEAIALPALEEVGMDLAMRFRGKEDYELAIRVAHRLLASWSVTLKE
jgi:hypothetical protein